MLTQPKKSLWFFCYYFPPSNIIGSSRAYEIARYFHENGWEVTIICGNPNDIPSNFHVDISIFNIIKVNDPILIQLLKKPFNFLKYFRSGIRLFLAYDFYRFSTKKMVASATKLLQITKHPDLIMASSPPFSLHVDIGRFAEKIKVPFIADNRDIWANNPYRRAFFLNRIFETKREHLALSKASAIIAISQGMKNYYKKTHPDLSNLVYMIRNGTDKEKISPLIKKQKSKDNITRIVYTGILYGKTRDLTPFFNSMQYVNKPCKVTFYGSEKHTVSSYAKKHSKTKIQYHEKVSRKKIRLIQQNADILIVALGKDIFEEHILPGKVFEYIESGRPIIALCNPDTELAFLINKFNLGIASRDKNLIANFINRYKKEDVFLEQKIPKELTRSYQLSKLNKIVGDIPQKNKESRQMHYL